MPRLRSQTRITGVLPRELLQRSLEFLPVREVYCEAQLISSEFLSASRRALTRGRWRPMALFSKEAEEHRNRFEYGADLSSWHETFKEVWALEPGEVFFELAYWDNYRYSAPCAAQFLKIVEPTIEGLSRIVAACELAQEAYDGDKKVVTLVGSWALTLSPLHLGHDNGYGLYLRLGHPPGRDNYRSWVLDREEQDRRFALGLESWTDPKLAASFVRDVLEYDGYFDEDGPYEALRENYNEWEFMEPSYRRTHEHWARDWRDRDRADAFVAECVRLQAEEALEQERDEREQWEAQHGWKYCPHGDKFWDCPHCSDEWHAGFENASGDDEED